MGPRRWRPSLAAPPPPPAQPASAGGEGACEGATRDAATRRARKDEVRVRAVNLAGLARKAARVGGSLEKLLDKTLDEDLFFLRSCARGGDDEAG
jgi:hypothetical protein